MTLVSELSWLQASPEREKDQTVQRPSILGIMNVPYGLVTLMGPVVAVVRTRPSRRRDGLPMEYHWSISIPFKRSEVAYSRFSP